MRARVLKVGLALFGMACMGLAILGIACMGMCGASHAQPLKPQDLVMAETSRVPRTNWTGFLLQSVAIEFQTYNPLGKLHEASFPMRVKEIQRGQEGSKP